jgi:hypothetical protein
MHAGELQTNGEKLGVRDGAMIVGADTPAPLTLQAGPQGAHFLMVEMAKPA